MPEGLAIAMSKHQAAGNDFLVLLDLAGDVRLSAVLARALCDRHLGVGADGLIRVLAGTSTDLLMELWNADGSTAQMSGNGIRCLVQASVDAGVVETGEVRVATAAGLRRVFYESTGPDEGYATVDMGKAEFGSEPPIEGLVRVRRAASVDMGNPHIVLLMDDVDDEVVNEIGPRLSASVAGGVNVGFVVEGPGRDAITLRVYERGVGETLACGTGACAASAASKTWGLTGDEVRVLLRGGELKVSIRDSGIELGGPTRKIADVSVSLPQLQKTSADLTGPEDVELLAGRP